MDVVAADVRSTGRIPDYPPSRSQTPEHDVAETQADPDLPVPPVLKLGGSWKWFLDDAKFWETKRIVVDWEYEGDSLSRYIVAQSPVTENGSVFVVVISGIRQHLVSIHLLRYRKRPMDAWATPVTGDHRGVVAKLLTVKRKNEQWVRFGKDKREKQPVIPDVSEKELSLFVEVGCPP
jgi:hypothetical protein